MFRTIEDFKEIWADERAKTLAVLRAIPTEKMHQAVDGERRTLGRLAWHLVESAVELPGHLGLTVEGPKLNDVGFIGEPVPATMDELVATYDRTSASVAEQVGTWKDADLDTIDELYHEKWRRGFSLYVLIAHQAHHRGQMTVLMRQAGIRPPDVYGPTVESWAGYGLPVPVV